MHFLPILDFPGAPILGTLFLALLFLQRRFPLRFQKFAAFSRVMRNLVFAIPSFLTLRLLLVPIPLAVAYWAQNHHFGLLNWTRFPAWLEGFLGIVLFDYAYYWWHIGTHCSPLLWRFHNVHHTDLDMDVSTATRFHFLELALSVVFRCAVVFVTGIAPLALLLFEVCFEAAGQFHHSNWRLPIRLESVLVRIFVTPRMHGIHHSIVQSETDSNWGTIFSWWDRIHRSLNLEVAQDAITIGVPAYRDPAELTLKDLFLMPFRAQRDWRLPDQEKPEKA